MRQLKDEAGELVEVPDQAELDAWKSKADAASRLEEELKNLTDKSAGLKNLRDAIGRKERRIGELEGELKGLKDRPAVSEDITKQVDDLDYDKRAENAARRVMLETEISRELGKFNDEERPKVKKYFDKLASGEELNSETMRVFLSEAERVAFPNRSTSSSRTMGRPPRIDSSEKSFGDTDEGRDLASRMGLKLEPKAKK